MSLGCGVTHDCTACVAIYIHCRYPECSIFAYCQCHCTLIAFHVFCCAVLSCSSCLCTAGNLLHSVLSAVLAGLILLRSRQCLTESAFHCIKFISVFVLWHFVVHCFSCLQQQDWVQLDTALYWKKCLQQQPITGLFICNMPFSCMRAIGRCEVWQPNRLVTRCLFCALQLRALLVFSQPLTELLRKFSLFTRYMKWLGR